MVIYSTWSRPQTYKTGLETMILEYNIFRTDTQAQDERELKQNVHVTIKKPQSETLTCNIFAPSSSPRSLPTFLDLRIIIYSCSSWKNSRAQLLRSALPPGRSRKNCNRRELCSVSCPKFGMARSVYVWGRCLVRLVSFPDVLHFVLAVWQ